MQATFQLQDSARSSDQQIRGPRPRARWAGQHKSDARNSNHHCVAHSNLRVPLPALDNRKRDLGDQFPRLIAVRLTPTMKSDAAIVLVPVSDASVSFASSATRTGRPSPAGEDVPRFPPSVPALRICGEPTVRDASAKAGMSDAIGSLINSV